MIERKRLRMVLNTLLYIFFGILLSNMSDLYMHEVNNVSFGSKRRDSIDLSRKEISVVIDPSTNLTENMVYFWHEKIFLAYSAKGASTALFHYLFTGVTGHENFTCSDWPQLVEMDCWEEKVFRFRDMPRKDQLHVLTSPDVLRVAVWREPFSRLVSCWKSKIACDEMKTGRDHDRDFRTRLLWKAAGLEPSSNCLGFSAYANLLEKIRRRVENGKTSLNDLDMHFRPQQFFFDLIKYDLIIDRKELSKKSKMLPIWQRLRYKDKVPPEVNIIHSSNNIKLIIDESDAQKISLYARLEPFPHTMRRHL